MTPVIFDTLAADPLAAAGFPAAVAFLKGFLIPAFSHGDLQIKGYFRRRSNCKRIFPEGRPCLLQKANII